MASIYEAYDKALRRHNAFDFDDDLDTDLLDFAEFQVAFDG